MHIRGTGIFEGGNVVGEGRFKEGVVAGRGEFGGDGKLLGGSGDLEGDAGGDSRTMFMRLGILGGVSGGGGGMVEESLEGEVGGWIIMSISFGTGGGCLKSGNTKGTF